MTSENVPSDMCAQRRFRSACAFAQSDQKLHTAQFRLPRMQSFFMRKTNQTAGLFQSSLDAYVRRYVFSRSGSGFSFSYAEYYSQIAVYTSPARHVLTELRRKKKGKQKCLLLKHPPSQRANDVFTIASQRRRCIDIMCLLGLFILVIKKKL